MGLIGGAAKLSPWARALIVGQLALLLKEHLEKLTSSERTELRQLLTKSKGRRSNLTEKERSRLMELVRKVEPGAFAKNAATKATPLRRKR
jgi:hypothetical protein